MPAFNSHAGLPLGPTTCLGEHTKPQRGFADRMRGELGAKEALPRSVAACLIFNDGKMDDETVPWMRRAGHRRDVVA